ncbi:MAG: hypothetical protein WCJ97_00175 [Phycisphaerae bacterium]
MLRERIAKARMIVGWGAVASALAALLGITLALTGIIAGDGLVSRLLAAAPGLVLLGIGLVGCVGSAHAVGLLEILRESEVMAADTRARSVELLTSILAIQKQTVDTLTLSEAAKRVAYRQKDREALREAIHEDIAHGDFDSALIMIDEMDKRFGYHTEAQSLRNQVSQAQKNSHDQDMQELMEVVYTHFGRYDWSSAVGEIDKLNKLHPKEPRVLALPDELKRARLAHKGELLKMWTDAVNRDDLDRSVELLKMLDQYLSPSEASAYKEAARDVFKKRLQQLATQFALQIHDCNWTQAITVGEMIIHEYPNARVAAEVQGKLDVLRANAAQAEALMPKTAVA